ncbi:unnamed protein product [Ectocarpus sp. 12 AP-2014]
MQKNEKHTLARARTHTHQGIFARKYPLVWIVALYTPFLPPGSKHTPRHRHVDAPFMPYAQLLFVDLSLSKPRTIWYNTESRGKHNHTTMNSEAAAPSWRFFSPAHRCYYCRPSVRLHPKHKQRTGNNDINLLLLHYPLPFHRHCSWRIVFASTPSLQAADKKKSSPGCALHIYNTVSSLRHPRQWQFSIPKCSFLIYGGCPSPQSMWEVQDYFFVLSGRFSNRRKVLNVARGTAVKHK